MKQIIQNYRTGEIELAEVPSPSCTSDKVLVKNNVSLISLGTERSIIELGKKSLLGKARARPDLVKRFVDKAKKEGLLKTFQEALGRLDNPMPLGYSSSGTVIEVGKNVHKLSTGDRVACIGAGYASHADFISIPENLCCKIPENVTFEEASFGMLGIIAMHGIRCANVTHGENVAVIGLGLLGLLTVQILKAYGFIVVGYDIDPNKAELAKKFGIDYAFISEDDFKKGVEKVTNGYGADAAIITAATKSDVPVNIAVDILRYRGKIVLVGVADVHPQRNEMWHKEVDIVVSKAGGAGTFDPFYEIRGIDYPIGYIRWTENRNLEEFLRLLSNKKIDVGSLISHRYKIDEAETVYSDMLNGKEKTRIGVLLQYAENDKSENLLANRFARVEGIDAVKTSSNDDITLGVIGAGLFGKALFLPALKNIGKANNVLFHTISTLSSANAYHIAKRYGFKDCTTNYREILDNKDINAVMILTPHSVHAKMVVEALKAGKHVFVEKPLCINEEELKEIINIYSTLCMENMPGNGHNKPLVLMVGYNRRFSPHTRNIVKYAADRKTPAVINYRVNPGFIPPHHWVHSPEEGGSRIIGEACHFIDMMQCITKSNPVKVYAERIGGDNRTSLNSDNTIITLRFEDGSIGSVIYTASGDKAFSRERIEFFFEGKTIMSQDYKNTEFFGSGKKNRFKTFNQEMGYKEEIQYFFDSVLGKNQMILNTNTAELFYSTLAVFKAVESLSKGAPMEVFL